MFVYSEVTFDVSTDGMNIISHHGVMGGCPFIALRAAGGEGPPPFGVIRGATARGWLAFGWGSYVLRFYVVARLCRKKVKRSGKLPKKVVKIFSIGISGDWSAS
jgi:hypothetical protein